MERFGTLSFGHYGPLGGGYHSPHGEANQLVFAATLLT